MKGEPSLLAVALMQGIVGAAFMAFARQLWRTARGNDTWLARKVKERLERYDAQEMPEWLRSLFCPKIMRSPRYLYFHAVCVWVLGSFSLAAALLAVAAYVSGS